MKRDVYLGNGCFGSGKELKHYKYISRKKVGGKWVYEYEDATPTTKKPKSTPSNFKRLTALEEAQLMRKDEKAYRKYVEAERAFDRADMIKENQDAEINAGPGERNLGVQMRYLSTGTRYHENKKRPDGAALQRERAEKRTAAETAAKKAQADKLKSASKMSTSGMTNIDKSTAKVNERARNDNRQMPDRAAEQVKLAEKRTAAKKAKVANIKSASKMKTTITDDSNIRSAKKPASTPVGKVSDEYKKNLEFNSQKNDYGNGKRKSALSENNKQNRLLKNLKKAIANARKKKKVQKK